MSYKKLSKNILQKNLSNEEYETDMVFVGFLLFENPMKKSTQSTIEELRRADVNTHMITGDNIYTAINVGYKSGILEE